MRYQENIRKDLIKSLWFLRDKQIYAGICRYMRRDSDFSSRARTCYDWKQIILLGKRENYLNDYTKGLNNIKGEERQSRE